MCNNSNCNGNHEEIRVEDLINIQTGKKIDMEKFNELRDNAMLKVRPELWIEWDFEKNDGLGLDIYEITYGSKKVTWWICLKCKSHYDMINKNRVKGSNCPYCHGLRINETNCLATTHPELVIEWHPVLNDKTPYEITYGNDKKVWWICKNCDSEYDMSLNCRTNGKQNCPYCAGMRVNHTNSLFTLRPDIALQWHPTKNGDLTPKDVTCGKGIKVWWLGECGHEWEASIADRCGNNRSCPYCTNQKVWIGFNDMWTTNTELASLLANPEDGYKYMQWSGQKVNWKCYNCGEIVENKRISSVHGQGLSCPNCSDGVSYPEKVMYHLLKQLNIEFDYNSTRKWSDNRLFDFYFEFEGKKIIIETHGRQHDDRGFEKLGGRSSEEEKINDKYKRELALNNGIDMYIEIDCKFSELEYIKHSILNGSLKNIFNLENIDWINIHLNSQKSFNLEILRLWNEKGLSIVEISEVIKLCKATVGRTLNKYAKIGLCEYDRYRTVRKFNKQAKKIYQFTKDMEFIRLWHGATKIKNELKINSSSISQCCTGKYKSAGGFIWKYEEDLIGWSVPIHNNSI